MTHTVNSGEHELIVFYDVTGGLLVSDPRSPGFGDGPVLGLNPSSGSESGDCSISISGIDKDLVTVGFQDRVDPN